MHHIVVTTINSPTVAIEQLAQGAQQRGWEFVIIGDSKSPSEFHVEGAKFWDVESQVKCGFEYARIVPTRHYARKNIGYLISMGQKAEVIVETDDDNLPLPSFWEARKPTVAANLINVGGWVNVYRGFSESLTWPRGFPLDEVSRESGPLRNGNVAMVDCPIQQGLANENPDVDAIYRLLLPLPLNFQDGDSVALQGQARCPFNSQNTSWFPKAYPLLYLPYHCSFRMTDIWRSFVAQRIALAKGWGLLFHNATMYQDRNEHDLMLDFKDEVVGYLNNRKIMDALNNLPVSSDAHDILDELIASYEVLIDLGVVGAEERALVQAWCRDVEKIASK